MLNKKITYVDFDGIERTEDFKFHLSKAEVMEMEMGVDGGMAEKLQKIVQLKDQKRIIEEFKDIILKSYGVKSDDGRRFIKNNELRAEFEQTEAYSILFMELATDAEAAAAFIRGIMPVIPEPMTIPNQK